MTFKQRYIGDKAFYKMLFVLLLPLVIQQGVTNFVSLLDNLMVGRVGTEEMSSVSIVNQLIFVFNLMIFGGISGVSIFGAQYAGVNDRTGLRYTFRFKMLFGVGATLLCAAVLYFYGDKLALLFLENDANADLDLTELLADARTYLRIMLAGLLPYMIVQVYSSTLREMGETVAPMAASVIAISVNTLFNYLLIFGKGGFPRLEVAGAAYATVLSRFVELFVVLIYTHTHKEKFPFIKNAYRRFYVPGDLCKRIIWTGTPLMCNELFWSLGMTFINRCYSVRGLTAVAAVNITSTAWNLFCVIMFAMGTAISIMVGRDLGRTDRKTAFRTARKLLFFSTVLHILIGVIVVLTAPLIPRLYNTEPEVRALSAAMLRIAGCTLPVHSLIHGLYFIIRSGGKTFVTLLMDSVYTWIVPAMIAFTLSRFTDLSVVWVYGAVQLSEFIKTTVGLCMFENGFWASTVIE